MVAQMIKYLICFFQFKGSSFNCLFHEKLSLDHYSEYQSLYNRSWFVGFNRKGKPLAGKEHIDTRRPHCFKFMTFHEKSLIPSANDKDYSPFSSEGLEKLLPIKPLKPKNKHNKRLKARKRKRLMRKLRHRRKKRLHRRRLRRPSR